MDLDHGEFKILLNDVEIAKVINMKESEMIRPVIDMYFPKDVIEIQIGGLEDISYAWGFGYNL